MYRDLVISDLGIDEGPAFAERRSGRCHKDGANSARAVYIHRRIVSISEPDTARTFTATPGPRYRRR
jgi:hypothetical protein